MAFINFINTGGGGGGNPEAEAQLSARTAELTGVIDRSISGITIPSGTTVIGAHAFDSCSALTEVTIHSGVTDIAANAFAENKALATITFEGENPPTIEDGAFSNLPKGVEIVVPEGHEDNYADVTEKVEESVIPWVTATDPNGDAYTFTYEDGAVPANKFVTWGSCKVEMSDNIIDIGYKAFSTMQALSSLTLSTGITSIWDYAFQHDGGVTGTISLPNIVNLGVGAFQNCSGITAVELGPNLTSIGDLAFENCTSLSSITFHTPTAPDIPENTLSNISSDCHWYVPADDPNFDFNSWNDKINHFNSLYSVNWVLCDLSGNPISRYKQFETIDDMRNINTWIVDFNNPPAGALSVMFDDESVLIIQNGNTLIMPTIGTDLRIETDGTAINLATNEPDDGTISEQYNKYLSWGTEDNYLHYDNYGNLAGDSKYEPAGWSSNPQSDDITGWLYDTTIV